MSVTEEQVANEFLSTEISSADRDRARKVNPLTLMPSAYKVVQCGRNRYKMLCPIHEDVNPSLALKKHDNGNWVWRCFGCGAHGDAIAFGQEVCGMGFVQSCKALLGEANQTRTPRVVTGRYDYLDEAGVLLYQVVRYHPKEFRQRCKTETGWRWGMAGVRRVLYRLPAIVSAPLLYYAEGEKDVHALEKLGLVATTNSGGAGAFWDNLLEPLSAQTQLVLVPDNDDPGINLMRRVFGAAKARGMPTPEYAYVPRGYKDVSDAIERGCDMGFLRLTRRGQ